MENHTYATVETYLDLVRGQWELTKDKGHSEFINNSRKPLSKGEQRNLPSKKEFATLCLTWLREARIFSFSYDDWLKVSESVSDYVFKNVALYSDEQYERWLDCIKDDAWFYEDGPDIPTAINKGELPDIHVIAREQTGQEFPAPLPFPNTYIGYGGGIPLSEIAKTLRQLDIKIPSQVYADKSAELNTISLLAHHIVHTNDPRFPRVVLAWYGYTARDLVLDPQPGYMMFTGYLCSTEYSLYRKNADDTHPVEGWEVNHSMDAWIVNAFVDIINDHKTIIEEGSPRKFRQKTRKVAKALGIKKPIPPPYYEVRLNDKYMRQQLIAYRSEGPTWVLNHRAEVRAHDRIRIIRGELPITQKTIDELEARNSKNKGTYHLFVDDQPPYRLAKALQDRGIELRKPGEFLAVLHTRINKYEKGPKESPLIPAVRITKKLRSKG